MLSEFLRDHRGEIIARCRLRVGERAAGGDTPSELQQEVAWLLDELQEVLDCELAGRAKPSVSGMQPARAPVRHGFTVAQVVHGYGDVCQTVTELAIERNVPISIAEFRVLNKCLDDAIADAVTAYERQHELDALAEGMRRSTVHLGEFAGALHVLLGSAMLAFGALRSGSVGIGGSTGDVLSRSLVELRSLVARSLTEARLAEGIVRPEHIAMAQFLEDIELAAMLSAHGRNLRLTVAAVAPDLTIESDRHILSSIVSALLDNALRYTRPYTHVWLRTHATADRVVFQIEDQCGAIPTDIIEHLLVRPAPDRAAGRALGLSVCVRGANALGGSLSVRNQNRGCVFTVDVPRRWSAPAS